MASVATIRAMIGSQSSFSGSDGGVTGALDGAFTSQLQQQSATTDTADTDSRQMVRSGTTRSSNSNAWAAQRAASTDSTASAETSVSSSVQGDRRVAAVKDHSTSSSSSDTASASGSDAETQTSRAASAPSENPADKADTADAQQDKSGQTADADAAQADVASDGTTALNAAGQAANAAPGAADVPAPATDVATETVADPSVQAAQNTDPAQGADITVTDPAVTDPVLQAMLAQVAGLAAGQAVPDATSSSTDDSTAVDTVAATDDVTSTDNTADSSDSASTAAADAQATALLAAMMGQQAAQPAANASATAALGSSDLAAAIGSSSRGPDVPAALPGNFAGQSGDAGSTASDATASASGTTGTLDGDLVDMGRFSGLLRSTSAQAASDTAGQSHAASTTTQDTTSSASPASTFATTQSSFTAAAAMPLTSNLLPTSATGGLVAANISVTTQSAAASSDVSDLDMLGLTIAAKTTEGFKHFSIRLDPPELGRVEVKLSVSASGQTSATLMADRPQTLSLLQQDSANLARTLQEAGVDLSGGGLNFSLRDGQQQDDGSGKGRGSDGQALQAIASVDTVGDVSSQSYLGLSSEDVRLDIRV